MSTNALKPCPFCGSARVRIVDFLDGEGDRVVAVGCEGCGCNGTPHLPLMDDPRSAASASWNQRATSGIHWRPIAEARLGGKRLMLWDSVSKRPVFGSWQGDNPKITHYAAEPAGPEAQDGTAVTMVSKAEAQGLSRRRVARMEGTE